MSVELINNAVQHLVRWQDCNELWTANEKAVRACLEWLMVHLHWG